MVKKVLDGTISISRPQFHDGRDAIVMTIVDSESRTQFISLEIAPGDLMLAMTGAHAMPMQFSVSNLSQVGFRREVKPFQFVISRDSHSSIMKSDIEEMLKTPSKVLTKELIDEGWIVNPHIGSQGSVQYSTDSILVNISIHRFVEV